MAALIVEPASISMPLLGAGLDESSMVATPTIAGAIRDSLLAIRDAALLRQGASGAEFPIA
jgi:chromate reductase